MNSTDWDAALFAAASTGDVAQATAALAAGANVNAANPHHVTPLIEASGNGHLDLVMLLLDRGASDRLHRDGARDRR